MVVLFVLAALLPPVAPRHPQTSTLHGVKRVDDYAWMTKKGSPEVEAYLRAENAYTAEVMRPTEALQKKLYDESLARLQQADTTAPYFEHGYEYFTRTEQAKPYQIMSRRKPGGSEEVLLDVNELGKNEKFIALGEFAPSIDGKFLAYATDVTGFREYTGHVLDVRTKKLLPDHFDKVSSMTWAKDGRTLFYCMEDAAKRPARVYRHVLGESKDTLVFDEKDERFTVDVGRGASDAFIFIASASKTSSEVLYIPADNPSATPVVIAAREPDLEYEVADHGDHFIIRANDKGRNFRLVTAPIAKPGHGEWKELVPQRADVLIENVDVLRDFYALIERRDGLQTLTLHDFASHKEVRVAMPEAVYSLFPHRNADWGAQSYRYNYMSFVTPRTTYDADAKTGTSTLVKRTPVLGFTPEAYVSERIFATAQDGTRVPISLVSKKGLGKDAPMLMTGYGSYGISFPVAFNPATVSLLDRGVIFAVAHVRGGMELGKAWHDAGRMMNKKNTFTDFIACAEHVIKQRYTSAGKLAITGGSAGGLLMGAVVNLRPDLFKAVVAQVPFVDVVNTMLDETLPLTVGEFEEWGNPKEKPAFDYMLSYSPYDNVTAQAYPAMLVKSAYNDSQVMYFEPAKWVAKLRRLKKGDHPLLLSMDMDPAGHGGKSDRFARMREQAFVNAFVLTQLSISQ